MKRFLPPTLTVLAASIAWPAAGDAMATRLADERWVVRSVSSSGRALVLEALGGPCGRAPRATVTETATTVEIRVQHRVPVDLSAIRCAAPEPDILRVRLSAPLGGRVLIGQSQRCGTVEHGPAASGLHRAG